MRTIIALVATLLAGPAAAQGAPADLQLAVEDAPEAKIAVQRAAALWSHDQAAWHTSDALTAALNRATPAEKAAAAQIRGWVTTRTAKGWVVVYHGEGPTPAALFTATWTGAGTKVVGARWAFANPYAWSDEQATLLAATRAAPPDGLERCSDRPFNRVVTRDPADPTQVLVYYLTPLEDFRRIPFGLHYRFTVAADAVVDRFQSTNSCIYVEPQRGGQIKATLMAITNLVSPFPTEFHIFGSQTATYPLAVLAPDGSLRHIITWLEDQAVVARAVEGAP
jgi:hypothetical protein